METLTHIRTEEELDDALSFPSAADSEAMTRLEGDLLILGIAGKMGPTLAALAKRACELAGVRKNIIGVARFSNPAVQDALEANGIQTIACDLLDRQAVQKLPDCPNVLFLAGQKFGTAGNQPQTWAINCYVPALAAERFSRSRIVALSTANVYPFVPVSQGGCREDDALGPVGEYAQSAVGRERMLEHFSARNKTPVAIVRLSYAIDLRYGVLRDVADKVFERKPVDLATGYANVVWQGDANSVVLRCLERCSTPPFVLNLSGPEILSVRSAAERFGSIWGIKPLFEGSESPTALLENTSRCWETFGPPRVPLDRMIEWVAHWVEKGGRSLGKPTHFEERTGRF